MSRSREPIAFCSISRRRELLTRARLEVALLQAGPEATGEDRRTALAALASLAAEPYGFSVFAAKVAKESGPHEEQPQLSSDQAEVTAADSTLWIALPSTTGTGQSWGLQATCGWQRPRLGAGAQACPVPGILL
jgi:hypothetical protein